MKVKVDIHKISGKLSQEFYEDLEMEDVDMDFDVEKIRTIALEKLHAEGAKQKKEEIRMKNKTPKRMVIAVAVMAALTTTAFAAGKTNFFREIFGSSIMQVEQNIQQVGISAENDTFKMTAEQLMSDGFYTKVIVSLEGKVKQARQYLFDPALMAMITIDSANRGTDDMAITGAERLWQFDTKEKAYYCVTYSNNQSYTAQPITIVFERIAPQDKLGEIDGAVAEPMLSLVIENPQSIDTQKSVSFEAPENQEDVYPVSLTINAISAVLTMQENEGTQTPTLDVVLVMKDGSREQIFDKGWISEDGTGGGGESWTEDQKATPLSIGNSYKRDLETNRIVQTSSFSRILDLKEADYVLIDGARHDLL